MEDYSSSSEDQSEENSQEIPFPATGRLRELVRTMLDEEVPGLYNDPRFLGLVDMDEDIPSDEELQHRLDELIGVTDEMDEGRYEIVSAGLLEAALGMRRGAGVTGNDELLRSINRDNHISKFSPGEELDAPPCLELVPPRDSEKWHKVALDTIDLVDSLDFVTVPTDEEEELPEPIDASNFYFYNDYNVRTDELVPHATIYANSDPTMGFHGLMHDTTEFPLLVVHLAKTVGHGCYHVRNSYPIIVWDPDEWHLEQREAHRPAEDMPGWDRGAPLIDAVVGSKSYPFHLHMLQQQIQHDIILMNLCSHLQDHKFVEKVRLQSVFLMHKTINGHDAYVLVSYRDSYIFCPDEVRQEVVDILVKKKGVFLGKAKEVCGFDLTSSFGDYFVGSDTLVSKADLVKPLDTNFEFGQPPMPMDKATYQELISAPADKESVPNSRRSPVLEEKVATHYNLMSHLSSTVRPDLQFCKDAVYWNSASRPNDESAKLHFEAFRTTFLYLMHTSESSIRFSLPPTKFSEWHVDCYLAYHPKVDPIFDGCAFVLMLNSEPLYWRTYKLGRYERNDQDAILSIVDGLVKTQIIRCLSSIAGKEELPVRLITDMSSTWLKDFYGFQSTICYPVLKNPTFVHVDPADNMALFLLKGAFGDDFKRQLRNFCMI